MTDNEWKLTTRVAELEMAMAAPRIAPAAIDQLRRMGINYMTRAGRYELEDWIVENAKPRKQSTNAPGREDGV